MNETTPRPHHARHRRRPLCAFDLIELDGEDLRRSSIEYRKRKLAKLVRSPELGIVLNEHYEGDGEIIFKHACKLGCEGIVSKRLGQALSYVYYESEPGQRSAATPSLTGSTLNPRTVL